MLFQEDWRQTMRDEVSAAIDESFGECVTVTPVNVPSPNFQSIPDESRAATVVAVFTHKAETAIMGGNHGRDSGRVSVSPLVSTSKPAFSFGYGVLPFRLLQGYRIERCNGDVYEITDVKPDGVSRIEVSVNQMGKERAV
jgi:hypothetical protein